MFGRQEAKTKPLMQRLDILALIMTVLFLVLGLTKADLPANDNDHSAMSVEVDTAVTGIVATKAQLSK